MTARHRTLLLVTLAVATGLAAAYVDSQPTWDDTIVTAVALWLAGAAFAFLGRHRPWLWALLVGLWIPLLELRGTASAASLLAIVFAFGGAMTGYILARWLVLDERIRDHP